MSNLKDMETLWCDVRECQKCDISKYVRYRVFGDGNTRAKILLIGEAPDTDEDNSGHPFTGDSGQILRKCLITAKIDFKRIFITNVLKCHPPKTLDPPRGNRKPSTEELTNCTPFLQKQIDIINPKIIVALGNTAGDILLNPEVPKIEITKMFGQVFKKDGRSIILTYHPRYLGYRNDPKLEKDYIDLFKRIKKWKKLAQ